MVAAASSTMMQKHLHVFHTKMYFNCIPPYTSSQQCVSWVRVASRAALFYEFRPGCCLFALLSYLTTHTHTPAHRHTYTPAHLHTSTHTHTYTRECMHCASCLKAATSNGSPRSSAGGRRGGSTKQDFVVARTKPEFTYTFLNGRLKLVCTTLSNIG